MSEFPVVSIIMPAYNAEKYIGQAIESVINQTYKNWELIIVDDCSTDSTLEKAYAFEKKDSRICIIKNPLNQGVATSRNKGIEVAQGKYIALLDSDDVWTIDKLERQLELIVDAQIVYCSYDFIDKNNRMIKKPFIVPKETNFNKMLVSNVISCSTILIDSELIKKNKFNKNYYHEDYVLWMQLLSIPVKAIGDEKVLMHYRQLETSRSHGKTNAAKHRWKIYREALGLDYITCICSFVGYVILGIKKYFG